MYVKSGFTAALSFLLTCNVVYSRFLSAIYSIVHCVFAVVCLCVYSGYVFLIIVCVCVCVQIGGVSPILASEAACDATEHHGRQV